MGPLVSTTSAAIPLQSLLPCQQKLTHYRGQKGLESILGTSDVTVAIISYNAETYISPLLDSLRIVKGPSPNIMLVDDASTDDTVMLVKHDYPYVTVVVNDHNQGHSAACNRAIDSCQTRYLIILDHDTVVNENYIQPLLDTIQSAPNEVAAATSRIVNYQGKSRNATELNYFVSSIPINEIPEGVPQLTPVAPTTSVLIDLDRCQDLRFDERFFIYNNDLDFFYRLRLRGLSIAVAPDSVVTHLTGTTELSNRGGRGYSPQRAFFQTRNRWLFLYKNYELRTLLVLGPMLLLHEVASIFVYLSMGYWEVLPKAIRSFLSLLPYLRPERRRVQSTRCVGDGQLLSTGPYGIQEAVLRGTLSQVLKRAMDWVLITYFYLASPFLNHKKGPNS